MEKQNNINTFKNRIRKTVVGFTINAIFGAATASAPTLEALLF